MRSASGLLRGLLLTCALVSLWSDAAAQGFFLPANDLRLREDISLLADEGVLAVPRNAWPLPAGDVAAAIRRISVDSLYEPALQAALRRIRTRVLPSTEDSEWNLRSSSAAGGKPGLLRDYGTLLRENAELESVGGASTDRWSLTIDATAVASPDDGQHLRLDGSEASVRWGNWIFSANALERWWGPAEHGSLILSTNARPMPGVSLDRLRSTPFDVPILGWLGPWRFTAVLERMEGRRPDVDAPLFMGMRLAFQPAQILEVGLSRTAQFCGKGRPCNGRTFWNVVAGNDNAGLRVSAQDEPGNQMAGIDVRLVSPFRAAPFSVYAQLIGEDASSSGVPERYLGLFGADTWIMTRSGAVLRARVEYANTNCKFAAPRANDGNCAYRQGIFTAGYRYKERNIGHTADADAEALSASFSLLQPNGQRWGLLLRRSLLDQYNGVDTYNPLTQGPGRHRAAELSWSGALFSQSLAVALGYERRDTAGPTAGSGLYGGLKWQIAL